MFRLMNERLESVYLRADEIGDEIMETMCERLKSSKVKCLDISMNCFGAKGVAMLGEAMKENVALEYLGLPGLNITIADLKPLLDEFGSFCVEPEELDELKKKIKERDAIIAKNEKSKGKKVEPVPKLPSITQDAQGKELVLKNDNFKHLSIGLNNLDDIAIEEIGQVLARAPSSFVMTVAGKFFSEGLVKSLAARYGERIVI
eukprot:TRINITY_DN14220_c0_g1_i5.p1 TRINITY_DN14220_c0_g1~~TRINITY_DN14220_c0_g1_i5.p1  ORF type:complete len:203 (+),score=46.76 TRINITY_DN14220_c0_g1_i5:643-1251(+)